MVSFLHQECEASVVKVSIIIPIYNTETYIEKCLNSLVNQTLRDIEIICVNDGSTDNSMIIVRKFANEDSRIKIIEQENRYATKQEQEILNKFSG